MENASKALVMAGGMLIAILIVTLLIYVWSKFTEYQASQDNLADIQDTAKFNAQFSGYDRDDVLGYELLSLLNRIVDYNEKRTTDSVYGNDEEYPAVSITIDLQDEDGNDGRKKFVYTLDEKYLLFDRTNYTDNELTVASGGTRTSFKRNIEDKIAEIKNDLGIQDETTLTSMAKNIAAIFKTESEKKGSAQLSGSNDPDYDAKMQVVHRGMVSTYNTYMKQYPLNYNDECYEMLTLKDDKSGTEKPIKPPGAGGKKFDNLYKTLCAYYEYMQFKRGVFKCTKLEYDQATGRVDEIAFKFTGKIR